MSEHCPYSQKMIHISNDLGPASTKVVPLTCHGHTRPINHLSFSSVVKDDQFYMLSACKGMKAVFGDDRK